MKQTIAVIFGGASTEYEISLMSASFFIRNIPHDKYDVKTVGITKTGAWYLYEGPVENIENGSWVNAPDNLSAALSPCRENSGLIVFSEKETQIIPLDVVAPILHGKNGEDGTIQGLLELSGIPYIGSKTTASAICMDKAITHALLSTANIAQAHYLWFYSDRYKADRDGIFNKICARFDFPVFVKPSNSGSSVGVSKVNCAEELDSAVALAARYDSKVVVEEAIVGRELECAVYGNRDAFASPVGEISAGAQFYDYNDKYKNGVAQTIVPANIAPEISDEIRRIAVKAYRYLGCNGLARVDFFLTENNTIILNEINTIPGFTPISMYPKLWNSAGVSAPQLVETLIQFALENN